MELKPVSVIKANLGINPGGRVEKFFTVSCAKHMDKYVPRKVGALRETVDIQPNSITYQSPYAHYQFTGKMYVMDNGKSAYYFDDYGFWSKPGGKKKLTNKELTYRTPRNRTILG